MPGSDDGDLGGSGVPSPRSARVPLPLRRLPAESLRKLYGALEELEAAGLQRLDDVGALRAAIAEKAGLSKELLPLEAFTTEYAAMSLWAWTPSRWRAACAKHGAPSGVAAPADAAAAAAAVKGGGVVGGGGGEAVADSECPIMRGVARARAAMRKTGWLVDERGNVQRVEPPAEKEESAPPEELADTMAGGGDSARPAAQGETEKESETLPAKEAEEDTENKEKEKRLAIWWRAMLGAGVELQKMAATADTLPTSKGDGLGVLFGDYRCLDGCAAKAPRKTNAVFSFGKLRSPKATSVVMVHVGGDGCGMGAAAWRRIQADHGLSAAADGGPLELPAEFADVDFGVHFSDTRAGKLVPRAIFAGSSDSLGFAGGLGCAPVDLLDGSSGDEGVTFYHGYWNHTRAEAIAEGVRRQMEMCDFCPYLLMTHSGSDDGADSGLACKVLESLKSTGNKYLVWSLCSVAPGEQASAASKMNAALSIHNGLMEHTDFSAMVDKESLLRVASAKVNGLGLVSPSLGDCWQLTSGVVAAWTSPLCFGKWVGASTGTRCLSPLGLTTNLVPYPRLHFGGPSYSPLVSAEMAQFDAGNNSVTVEHALAGGRLSNGIVGKRLCGALLCRGIRHSEALPRVCEAKGRTEAVDWSPIGFAVGSHDARSVPEGPAAEAVGWHSTAGFGKLFASWLPGFDDLSDSERSAYLEVGPFNKECLDEAREDLERLVQDYTEVCLDTQDEDEDEEDF